MSKKLLWLAGWWLLRTDGANIFISKLESGWADITWVASQIFRVFVRVLLIVTATKQWLSIWVIYSNWQMAPPSQLASQ